jgi:tetratricopeptide (TPR) repeat protein
MIQARRAVAKELINARYLFTRKEYHAAAMECRDALALDPDNVVAHYILRVAHNSARQDLNKYLASLRKNPDNPDMYLILGDLYEQVGNHDSAVAMYKEAVRLEPTLYEAYNNLGLLYGRRGDYERAIAVFEKALGINPQALTTVYNLGIAYYWKGDHGMAEKICRRALTYPVPRGETEIRLRIEETLKLIERENMQAKAALTAVN